MPQSPMQVYPATNGGKAKPQRVDASGSLVIGNGASSTLNITASAVVKATAGRIAKISVLVAGSAVGKIHDCALVADAAAANKIYDVPNTVGVYDIDWPCATGIVYVVGTGQTVAISYA